MTATKERQRTRLNAGTNIRYMNIIRGFNCNRAFTYVSWPMVILYMLRLRLSAIVSLELVC